MPRPVEANYLYTPDAPIYPKERLLVDVKNSPRRVEDCWWHHPVQIDFDLGSPGKLPRDPLHREFLLGIGEHLVAKKHTILDRPSNEKTDMLVGFYDIPKGPGSLFDRVEELEDPMILNATEKYKAMYKDPGTGDLMEENFNAFQKNYTLVVTIDEDIAKMKKRDAETITRMLMARLGALKIVMIHKGKDERPDYYALGTMEGGLAVESLDKPGALERFADRLVTHACAKESGSFEKVPGVVSESQWEKHGVPDYIASASRQLASWGYIDKPFEISRVASKARVRLINLIMGYSRQSESAIAAFDPMIIAPENYRIGKDIEGVIISSKSGRFGADKTLLKREETIPVAIVPNEKYQAGRTGQSLEAFNRYSLGIGDRDVAGPSIEFDEMSAAILNSGFVRARRHPSGHGYILDMDHGDIWLPRVRGFVHLHQGVDKILPQKMWTQNAQDFVEYIPANLKDYPYPVGCGKDIMFGCSTDAASRSTAIKNINSGVQVALFDAMDHGTNALLLTEPMPGTDGYIPENPFDTFLQLVDPRYGVIQFSDELAMV